MKEQEIIDMLKKEIAQHAEMKVSEIDVEEPFAGYGLDSIAAVQLSAKLETILQVQLHPTLYWDYPNIAQLAKFLSEQTEATKKAS